MGLEVFDQVGQLIIELAKADARIKVLEAECRAARQCVLDMGTADKLVAYDEAREATGEL